MKSVFSLFIILLSSNIYGQWFELPSPTSSDLQSVFFTDSLKGFIVGNNGTALRTSNGGETWENMIIPLDSSEREKSDFIKIKFISELDGIFMGYSNNYNFLFKTLDGGINWELTYLPEDFELSDFDYVNEDGIWLVARTYDLGMQIYFSSNGGSDWNIQPKPTESPILRIDFLDSLYGVCVGTTTILLTDDFGNSWSEIEDGANMQFNDVVYQSSNLIYSVVINRDNYKSHFYKSIDGGYLWELSNQRFSNLKTIFPVNDSTIFIGGYGDGIFASDDFGETWRKQNLVNNQEGFGNINSINTTYSVGYAVGESGRIYKTNDTSITSIHNDVSDNEDFRLFHNYPNPFNANTKIRFILPLQGKVELTVYNSLGEILITLLNDIKSQGSYEIDFDGSNLSSGIYYYSLKVGNSVKVKKMLLLK